MQRETVSQSSVNESQRNVKLFHSRVSMSQNATWNCFTVERQWVTMQRETVSQFNWPLTTMTFIPRFEFFFSSDIKLHGAQKHIPATWCAENKEAISI